MKIFLFILLIGTVLLAGCMDGLGNQRADQQGNTVVGQVKARANDEKCIENLRQIRAAIEIAKTSGDDTLPTSMNDLRLPAEMLVCPNDKQPYDYDSTNGTVKCHHPGHAKY